MGVKRGRGRTSSPAQSRASLLVVKGGGESFSNHKIWDGQVKMEGRGMAQWCRGAYEKGAEYYKKPLLPTP